jgi:hypothetical protein
MAEGSEIDSRLREARQRFLVVQLAIFNADVLWQVQQTADATPHNGCRDIVNKAAERHIHSFPPAPDTVNQSLFFSMAYLALVWLRESLSRDQLEQTVQSEHVRDFFEAVTAQGPRILTETEQYLRLIRNALSHGNVETCDPFDFKFWDQTKHGRNAEAEPTFVTLSSAQLGKLTHRFYYAASEVLYSNEG